MKAPTVRARLFRPMAGMLGLSLLFASGAIAQAPPAPSAADLALGKDIAAKMLPDGTYKKIMGGTLSKTIGGMTDQMAAMPIAPFLKAAGLLPTETAKFDAVTIKQIMDIVDPAYQDRMRVVMPVMMEQMGEVMTQFEPEMREGLGQAYALHFTSAQLADIDHFLNTPSGSAFANQGMTIAADPAVMQRMQTFMPMLMKSMPDIMQKAFAATADLPKPKTATLTDDDRARLAKLLGVDPVKLKKAPAT